MKKEKFKFVCQECGQEASRWLGKCSACGKFNTLQEEYIFEETKRRDVFSIGVPRPLREIKTEDYPRKKLWGEEINRVLGGGIVPGSLILVGGEPGIGKSTLLLQISNFVSLNFGKVLYVSGEESPQQVRLRAERIGCNAENLFFASESDLQKIIKYISDMKPELVVIDSVQTVFDADVPSSVGSVSQIKEVTTSLMHLAKRENIPIFIIGHVTKEGAIAGPKILEHIVDTVLYFEGEKYHTYRLLRCVKNRFGSTSELGIFEMQSKGLVEVENAAEVFLMSRENTTSGFCITSALEGTRLIALEVQALVSYCAMGIPRRTCPGIDYNRLSLILAVLEKRVGISFSHQDVYLNLPGGIKTEDVATDVGVASAVVSALKDKPPPDKTMVMGEICLTGEIRSISSVEKRLKEVQRLGFKKAIIPYQNLQKANFSDISLEICGVKTIKESLRELNLL